MILLIVGLLSLCFDAVLYSGMVVVNRSHSSYNGDNCLYFGMILLIVG